MKTEKQDKTAWRILTVGLVVMIGLALASGVWASPTQRDLRQTVPTRTPTAEPPTATPVSPTATPVPPTATPEKKNDTSGGSQEPTAAPTEVVAEATPEAAQPDDSAAVQATTEAISSAEYPTSGGDWTPLLGLVSGALALGGSGAYLIRRRRAAR